ncbi:hypothetical protein HDV06_006059 [Boothiomyces sp. JEL0866]|nr:hypothetical protein HDV06_006009 [Boothiomyces sp. JEL0866]KAJ3324801.1 hypothetical protein HDV06_006059 [Boothiomyces sp. JEL0866]
MSLKAKRFPGPKPDLDPEVPAYSKEKYVANSLEKYGMRGNVMDEIEKIKSLTHGVRMNSIDSVADVLSPNRLNPLLQEMEDNRERAYHRKEHQILGRSAGCDVVLPEFTKTDSFRFGKVTQLDESVGKIMYPPKKPDEDPIIKQRYILSHGSFGPGEQKKHYPPDWTPAEYRETVEMKRLANDGGKVKEALYWKENRRRELEQKIISAGLAAFHDRHQPEIGKVFDPLKSTLAHLPSDHTFGVKHPIKDIHVSDLLGNIPKCYTTNHVKVDIDKRPPAGITMKHTDDLDLQRHIIPKLGPLEDMVISKKITEDEIGGTSSLKSQIMTQFGKEHVFGVPTIRDPTGRKGMGPKRLADKTNYGDELGAKGLMYPTPRNVYGQHNLKILAAKMETA